MNKGDRADLERLLVPWEAERWRVHDLGNKISEARTKGDQRMIALLEGSHKLARMAEAARATELGIGLRALLDVADDADDGAAKDYSDGFLLSRELALPAVAGACVLCDRPVTEAERVTGQASGPRGVVLHDGEVAHAPCFTILSGRA